MGGGEVARYLSRYGAQNVAQTILVSSIVPYLAKTPDTPDGVDLMMLGHMSAAMKIDRAKFFTGFFKTFFGEGLLHKPVSNEVLAWTHDLAMMASLKATLACAEAFATHRLPQ